MDNLPDIIFDWIQEKSYSQLSSEEKEFLKDYISSEDYMDLYNTFYEAKSRIQSKTLDISDRRQSIWGEWNTKKSIQNSTTNLLWKIAASLLIVSSIALIVDNMRLRTSLNTQKKMTYRTTPVVYKRDTIFQSKLDTIYVKEYIEEKIPEAKKLLSIHRKTKPSHHYSIDTEFELSDNFIRNINPNTSISKHYNFSDSLIHSIGFQYSEFESIESYR